MSLTNPQVEKIMRQYDRIRAEAREDQQRRIDEAFATVPGLKETEQRIADLSFERARQKLSGGTDEDELRRQLALLRDRRASLLSDAGYPADQLNLRYHCDLCHDTGYVDGRKCSCFRKAESELFFAEQPARARLETDTFDRFRLDYYEDKPQDGDEESPREHMRDILQDSLSYVKDFRPGEENLLIIGQTGTGKTFLSHCIAGALIEQGFSVVLLSSEELFRILADHAMGRDREEDGAWRLAMEADLLVIDDLGAEVNNTLANAQLFSCMERRSMTGKSTLISTNLSLENIRDIYSERVVSRLIESYTIYYLYNYDSDIRLKVRQERQKEKRQ